MEIMPGDRAAGRLLLFHRGLWPPGMWKPSLKCTETGKSWLLSSFGMMRIFWDHRLRQLIILCRDGLWQRLLLQLSPTARLQKKEDMSRWNWNPCPCRTRWRILTRKINTRLPSGWGASAGKSRKSSASGAGNGVHQAEGDGANRSGTVLRRRTGDEEHPYPAAAD